MRHFALFWPLTLIAAGILWILVNMQVVPAANLWALANMLPYLLIGMGLGLIVRDRWPVVSMGITVLLVAAAVLAVVYAPKLGWAQPPAWGWGFDSEIGGRIQGSGEVASETRDVKDFLAVSIKYPAQVVIRQGATESVTVEAEDNLLPQLSTKTSMGVLTFENSERDWARRVDPTRPVKLTVVVKDLHELNFSSAGSVRIESLQTDSLKLNVSGAGELTLTKLQVHGLDVRISGAGNLHADGVADDLRLQVSGFGNLYGDGLYSLTADVRISGAGSASVRVKNKLSAEISGAGSIGYYGSPEVHERVTGAGGVRQLGK